MENPIKMDDLEVPLFLETTIFRCYVRFPGGNINNPNLNQWSFATTLILSKKKPLAIPDLTLVSCNWRPSLTGKIYEGLQ